MRCLFDSPGTACKQIKGLGTIRGTVSCRPYAHREPETTRWFVSPGTEWPVFHYARLFSDWDPDRPGALRIGAMVTKGLGSTMTPHLKKVGGRPLVMGKGWYWRDVIEEGESGLFVEAVVTAAATVSKPLHLEIVGGVFGPEAGADPYDGRYPLDRLILTVERSGALVPVREELQGDLLVPLAKATDIDAVAAELRRQTAEDWPWIDVLVWMSLDSSQKTGKGASKKDPVLTINELWETLLSPFESWLYA